MYLTRKYYMLNYYNYKDVFKFFDYVKHIEKQLSTRNDLLTPNKPTLICFIMMS